MHERVAQQVGEHLAQPHLVAGDDQRRGDPGADRAAAVGGAGVGAGVLHQRLHVDRPGLERPALVETCEQQQVVDEDPHALGLVVDAAHRDGEVVRGHVGVAAQQLRITAHRGERSAQLVGRVGDEVPQPLLVGLALGEGGLELGEHGVERQAEPSHLGALVRRRHPLAEVGEHDRARRRADALERPQPAAHQQRGGEHHHQGDAAGDGQLEEQQLAQGGVDVVEGDGDLQDVAGSRPGGRLHVDPIVADAPGAGDGVQLRLRHRGEGGGQDGARAAVVVRRPDVGGAEQLARRGAQLAVGAGRKGAGAGPGPPAAPPVEASRAAGAGQARLDFERLLDAHVPGRQLVVDA